VIGQFPTLENQRKVDNEGVNSLGTLSMLSLRMFLQDARGRLVCDRCPIFRGCCQQRINTTNPGNGGESLRRDEFNSQSENPNL
jgi:hypothetical protein